MKPGMNVLICILAAAQQATAAEPRGPASFDALDRDKDGVITVIESRADQNVAAHFSTADKNQDGYLTRAEFEAIPRS
jgi:Ca2+-binding EF-hand superfamily protein